MTMETVEKYYPERYDCYGGKVIEAVIRWTPTFLQSIFIEFELDGKFTSLDIANLFKHIFSENAARLKLFRMYKQGWFTRKLEVINENNEVKSIYFYQFSESAKKYFIEWGGFADPGPITKKK
jgi:hypothetical protein